MVFGIIGNPVQPRFHGLDIFTMGRSDLAVARIGEFDACHCSFPLKSSPWRKLCCPAHQSLIIRRTACLGLTMSGGVAVRSIGFGITRERLSEFILPLQITS